MTEKQEKLNKPRTEAYDKAYINLRLANSNINRLRNEISTTEEDDDYKKRHYPLEYYQFDKEVEDNKYASFIDYEDDDLFGLTNYYIDLVDDISKSRETVDVKYRIHIIDSNTYHYTGIKYGYDYIKEEQLEHVNNIYNNIIS